MWNPIQVTKSYKPVIVLFILALLFLMLFSFQVGIRDKVKNPFAEKSKTTQQPEETTTLSQDGIISIVRNLPEVKNFFEISLNSRREDVKYEPKIVVEKYEDNLWHLWVFENVRYDTGIGHATTFNRYVVGDTGKVKCSFAIYEGIKLIKVSSINEYPCK